MRRLLAIADPNMWSQISAIVFGLMFMILIVWVYLPSGKSKYCKAERLPLEDEA